MRAPARNAATETRATSDSTPAISPIMIDGHTKLIAHLGYPTENFKAPMIYNPYFAAQRINAVVVPMGVRPEDFLTALPLIARLSNFHGALITMPHKVAMIDLIDEASTAVKIAGSCNAVKRRADGALIGDMFDGEGFVRGLKRKGCPLRGARALVVGSGGVGSAIAAALAAEGLSHLAIYDVDAKAMEALARRLSDHYPALPIATGSNDPEGQDIIVNATPLGSRPSDAMPIDMARLPPTSFVGEVVMKQDITAFVATAMARGCQVQIGIDMLFEQIPAYLEFFGFPATNADYLRQLAQISSRAEGT